MSYMFEVVLIVLADFNEQAAAMSSRFSLGLTAFPVGI